MNVYQYVIICGILIDQGKAHFNPKIVNYEKVLIYKRSKFVGGPDFM